MVRVFLVLRFLAFTFPLSSSQVACVGCVRRIFSIDILNCLPGLAGSFFGDALDVPVLPDFVMGGIDVFDCDFNGTTSFERF